jgi:hypothetical protein
MRGVALWKLIASLPWSLMGLFFSITNEKIHFSMAGCENPGPRNESSDERSKEVVDATRLEK